MAETSAVPAVIAEKFGTEDECAAATWGWQLGWSACQEAIYAALANGPGWVSGDVSATQESENKP